MSPGIMPLTSQEVNQIPKNEPVYEWTDLLKKKQKKPKENATGNQRKELLNFMQENPELVTHSSTKENEASLWEEVTRRLNLLLPEKSVASWQNFWKRWQMNIKTKDTNSMTLVDYDLKKFLATVMDHSNSNAVDLSTPSLKKKITKMTYDQVCNSLKEVDEEKKNLMVEIDKMEFNITLFHNQINHLKKMVTIKKKQVGKLSARKSNLNCQRKKMEGRENSK